MSKIPMRLAETWNHFWFLPSTPLGVRAARVILAGNALWIVLSRPGLPTLRAWPDPFWRPIDPGLLHRFLIFDLPVSADVVLYWILCASLIACIAGVLPRHNCFVSALLLYHFAPFEDILASSGGPFFHGLTVPVTGLFVLSFAQHPRPNAQKSSEWRWPLTVIQLLFASTYLFSGISKLRHPGFTWITGGNFEGLVLGMVFPDSRPAWGAFFIGNDVLTWGGAIAGIAMDLLFVTVVFSRKAARYVVPLVAIIHVLVIQILGVVFLNIPLLLLFLNWDWIHDRWRGGSRMSTGGSEMAIAAGTQSIRQEHEGIE